MEIAVLASSLTLVTVAGLLLLRDVLVLRDRIIKGKTDQNPITPLVKNILSATEAVSAVPNLLGYKQQLGCRVSEVSEDVLKDIGHELKSAIGLDCVLGFGFSADRCEFFGTDPKLLSCFLACRSFLFDPELEKFVRLPFCGSCESLAAFGIFGAQGFSYLFVEKFSKDPIGIMIFGSQRPIELAKISRWIAHIEKEVELRQRLFELQSELEELSNKSALLQRKLAGVAHDFKSPIQTLNLVLSQFESENPGSLVNVGKSSLELLRDLVERCLEDSDRETYFCSIQLSSLVNELVGIMSPVLRHLRKRFDVHISDDLIVHVNHMDLKRIILNLVSNSAKYSGGDVVIIRGYQEGDRVIARIEDTNSSIDNEFLAKLEMRYLLDLARREARFPNAHGFGTGLLNVALLCSRNGIEFRAGRSESSGLRVELVFPKRSAQANSE